MKFYREALIQIRLRDADFEGYYRTINISNLRVSFGIVKSTSSTTNSAVIRIWNLKNETRNQIKDFGDEVSLFAGYRDDGGPQLLFKGQTTAVMHLYDYPEIISVLECGDGDRFINNKTVKIAFGAGVQARTILSEVARQMGIPFTEFATSDNLIYRNGYFHIGDPRKVLQDVCEKLNLQYSIQYDELQVIPVNGSINQPIIQINEQTGMQGVPTRFTYRQLQTYRSEEQPHTGYKVNVALNPMIIPGSRIDLDSSPAHLNFRGLYRVETVRHDGDTYGPVWTSQLQVTELSGPTQGVNNA